MRSVDCGQGRGTSGSTFETNGYACGLSVLQKVAGSRSTSSMRSIDLIDLKPYFHGTTSRIGAPCCLSSGWPYMLVASSVSSFAASASVNPSTYGQGA